MCLPNSMNKMNDELKKKQSSKVLLLLKKCYQEEIQCFNKKETVFLKRLIWRIKTIAIA